MTMNSSGGGCVTGTGSMWQCAALLRPGVLEFAGSIGSTDRHPHLAVQIMTATTPLTVVDDAGARHRGTA